MQANITPQMRACARASQAIVVGGCIYLVAIAVTSLAKRNLREIDGRALQSNEAESDQVSIPVTRAGELVGFVTPAELSFVVEESLSDVDLEALVTLPSSMVGLNA